MDSDTPNDGNEAASNPVTTNEIPAGEPIDHLSVPSLASKPALPPSEIPSELRLPPETLQPQQSLPPGPQYSEPPPPEPQYEEPLPPAPEYNEPTPSEPENDEPSPPEPQFDEPPPPESEYDEPPPSEPDYEDYTQIEPEENEEEDEDEEEELLPTQYTGGAYMSNGASQSGSKPYNLGVASEEEPTVESLSETLKTPDEIKTRITSEDALENKEDEDFRFQIENQRGPPDESIPSSFAELREILDDDEEDEDEETYGGQPITSQLPGTIIQPETKDLSTELIDNISDEEAPPEYAIYEPEVDSRYEPQYKPQTPATSGPTGGIGTTVKCSNVPSSAEAGILDALLGIEQYPCNECDTITDIQDLSDTLGESMQFVAEMLGQLVDLVVSKFKNNNENSFVRS